MTKFKLFSAALIMSAAIATPALAGGMQVAEVIQEPGLYAFYHPNGDLGLGSSRPADAMAQSLRGGEVSGMRMSVRRRHVSHALVHQALLKSVCPGSTSGLNPPVCYLHVASN